MHLATWAPRCLTITTPCCQLNCLCIQAQSSHLSSGCEMWTPHRNHIKKLEAFHVHILRSILLIHCQDQVTNRILQRAQSTSIEVMILRVQLWWTRHVICMVKRRTSWQLLYGKFSEGHRPQGCPHKWYKDWFKANLQYSGIHPKVLESAAADRRQWWYLIRTACQTFEENHCQFLQDARERWQWAGVSSAPTTIDLSWPTCRKLCMLLELAHTAI